MLLTELLKIFPLILTLIRKQLKAYLPVNIQANDR